MLSMIGGRLSRIVTRQKTSRRFYSTVEANQCGTSGAQNKVDHERVSKVVVVGAPNAGKSTLINNLIGQKVFPVSAKVHTTRQSNVGVFSRETSQVILLDTPGMIPYQYGRRLRMSKSFLTGAQRSAEEANLMLIIADASNKKTRLELDKGILEVLRANPSLPAALVLNKVDLLKHKHILLQVASAITEAAKNDLKEFEEVFMVSALTGNGIEKLRDYLISSCQPSEWEYGVNDTTDQSPETMVEELVREQLLNHLDKEIPYIIKQSTVVWEFENGKLTVLKNLECKKKSQVSIVIGPAGTTIQSITAKAQTALESALKCTVDLSLNVRTI